MPQYSHRAVNLAWWQDFFDDDYYEIWGGLFTAADSAREADMLLSLLHLQPGHRVLDAPCGYGRLSKALADRGCEVVGADFSPHLLEHAEELRGHHGEATLRYVRSDLRYKHERIRPAYFDGAINMFSSLGYGSDDDDDAILGNIARCLKPGGLFFIDTMHRDAIILRMERGIRPGKDMPDGTWIQEFPRLDPVAGRIETVWRWRTPRGREGQQSASICIYTITELVHKLERAGFELVSLHRGCSKEPFSDDHLHERVGFLATRVH